QNGNIAPGALKHAHVPAQLIHRHWRGRRTVLDEGYEPARLRKSLAWCKPATGCRKSRARHAAETKTPARTYVLLSHTHGFLLTGLRFPAVIAQDVAPGLGLSAPKEIAQQCCAAGFQFDLCPVWVDAVEKVSKVKLWN